MAQDLGLFRDVEKWFLPVQRFTHEEKQTRKRIWWGCIIIDRYTSSYIGRPGAIHERDYDTGFCSEDEPDEHEQWRPIRLDGTDWHSPPKNVDSQFPEEIARGLKNYPTMRANTLSCFNAHAALAVIINRVGFFLNETGKSSSLTRSAEICRSSPTSMLFEFEF